MDEAGGSGGRSPLPPIAPTHSNPSPASPSLSSSPSRHPQFIPHTPHTPPQNASVPHEITPSSSPSRLLPTPHSSPHHLPGTQLPHATHSPAHVHLMTPRNESTQHGIEGGTQPNEEKTEEDPDALPVPSAPTLPPSPTLAHLPMPSAPIAEEEDDGGTTPASLPSPSHHMPQDPPKYEKLSADAIDSLFPHASKENDLPPYSPTMAPPRKPQRVHWASETGLRERDKPAALPTRKDSFRVGVNLVRAAKRLLEYLRRVDFHGGLYEGELVERALVR